MKSVQVSYCVFHGVVSLEVLIEPHYYLICLSYLHATKVHITYVTAFIIATSLRDFNLLLQNQFSDVGEIFGGPSGSVQIILTTVFIPSNAPSAKKNGKRSGVYFEQNGTRMMIFKNHSLYFSICSG